MKKQGFIMGSIELILGILTFIQTSVLQELMTKIGYAAFVASRGGSYSPSDYKMNFMLPNFLGIVLCIVGAVTIFITFKKSEK